ncbi:uncharacterized protein LOC117323434 [Pecten maximus]|uniref:uncharacterized protein LOC117323434 n=1 Tax=Pecten maximus TaxID=6579 RepID=UPI001458EF24|nr:uncharacterized protein LOC117323434 [Pecten maximus]
MSKCFVNQDRVQKQPQEKGQPPTNPVPSLLRDLETRFTASQNSKNAVGMKQYMRNQFEFYGIMSPGLRSIAKEVFAAQPELTRDQALELLLEAWQKPNREFQILATNYAMKNASVLIGTDIKSSMHSLDTIQKLIVHKSWWDTVDMLAVNVIGPMVATYPDELGRVMDRWIDDSNMWLRRTAILHQLKYKHKTDSQKLFRYCLMRSEEKEFFIRKAIGWALREYGKTNRKEVKEFVTEHQETLSNLSVREALKHIK